MPKTRVRSRSYERQTGSMPRSYRFNGRWYPITASPRCHTCGSPQRATAERLVIEGVGYTEAARRLPEDAGLSAKTIREHCIRGHIPVDDEIARQLVESTEGRHAAVLAAGVEAR